MKIGIIGFGFMGRMHYRCWKGIDDVQITAICEPDENNLKESSGGNIDGAAETIDLTGIGIHKDLDEMLRTEDLDAVSITVPSFLHADLSVKALNAGVHVLCEKPMALTLEHCDRMIDAAEKNKKTLQIGHCIRFWPEYAKAHEIIKNGEYGKVIAASFRRLGSAPTWGNKWFLDEKRSGGVEFDLHIHDTDYIQYLFGVPRAVSSVGGQNYINTQYLYEDGKVIIAEGSWAMTPSFGFEMSFNIMLEKATIVYDCTRDPAFRVCPGEGEVLTPEIEAGDGYNHEINHFAKTIRKEPVESVVTPEDARDAVRIVLAEKESSAKKGKVNL